MDAVTKEEIEDLQDYVQLLQADIKQAHSAIGRMFAKGLITADMITEALDDDTDTNDYDSLKVIYNSWGGQPIDNTDAVSTFIRTLTTIRSYY